DKYDTLSFLYADIRSGVFEKPCTDTIILASVIQYFPDPHILLSNLQKILTPEGQIHIIDSPFYREENVLFAKQRSEKYFIESGQPEMRSYYFHHSWKVLE